MASKYRMLEKIFKSYLGIERINLLKILNLFICNARVH